MSGDEHAEIKKLQEQVAAIEKKLDLLIETVAQGKKAKVKKPPASKDKHG